MSRRGHAPFVSGAAHLPPEAQPVGRSILRWRSLARLLSPHRRPLAVGQICSLIGAVSLVVMPLLFPALVDEVILEEPGPVLPWLRRIVPEGWQSPLGYVWVMLAVTLALRFVSLASGVVQAKMFSIVSKGVTYSLRVACLDHLRATTLAAYETLGAGAVASRLQSDLGTLETFTGKSVSRLLVNVLTVLAIAAVLLWIHWPLAVVILGLNPLVLSFTTVLGQRVRDLKRRENQAMEVFQAALTEALDSIQQLRSANRERYYFEKLRSSASVVRDSGAEFSWRNEAYTRLSFTAFLFGYDLFRAVSLAMVITSSLTIGQMLAVFSYLWLMMSPVQEILEVRYSFFAAEAALSRINGLLALEVEPVSGAPRNAVPATPPLGIEVESLSFQYPQRGVVLTDVSLSIAAGEQVAVVGASGSGKSTLMQLLLRLYVPDRGRILFDGVAADNLDVFQLRESIGYVMQHPVLMNESLRDNLAFGRTVEDSPMWEALRMVLLDDLVSTWPEGLDTRIGRNGIRLSGGQRQRLAIARMILSKPRLAILDEATSSLDFETEERLLASLTPFLRQRTTLIVAHRPQTLRYVDRVLLLERGRVVPIGLNRYLAQQA